MTLGPSLYWQTIDPAHALARWMPYRLVFILMPGFDAMRAPERFGNLVLLGLAGLVSFGSAGLLARCTWSPSTRFTSRLGRAALHIGVAFLILGGVGAEYLHQPLRPATVPAPPAVYSWLATQPTGPVLELPITVPANELNREQVRQYWSTSNWQPRVNGSSDIAPRAYQALRRDLSSFPIRAPSAYCKDLGFAMWSSIAHNSPPPTGPHCCCAPMHLARVLQPAGEFGDDLVYTILPDARYAVLRQQIPVAADIFLSDADPTGTDAYMAMLGWVLRDSTLHSRVVPTFGQRYARAAPDGLSAWVICYREENPVRYGYPANLPLVYEDAVVRVYRNNRTK